jgi:hypothetical protein
MMQKIRMNDPCEDHDPVLDDPVPDQVVDIEKLQNGRFFEKVKFAWRHEDSEILDKIEGAAQDVTDAMFNGARLEVATFYALLRDEDGRENWSRLDVHEVEQIMMNLQRIKFNMAPEVNKLKNRAGYGKMVGDDIKDISWPKTMQGTQGDKQARANRESQADRYHAYFRYCIWSSADVLLKEVTDFVFRLRDIRNWQIQSQ